MGGEAAVGGWLRWRLTRQVSIAGEEKEIVVPDWLDLLLRCLAVIGPIAVAIVAVFQNRIHAWLDRPELEVSVDVGHPDCVKAIFEQKIYSTGGQVGKVSADCYYFRLRVKNEGNQRAEQVEVFAAELLKEQASGMFKVEDSFLPMRLRWSSTPKPISVWGGISPEMYKHCDIAHIIDPKKRKEFGAEDKQWPNVPPGEAILSFDTEVQPYTLNYLQPSGTYRLVLLVSAANSRPVRRTLEITLKKWFDDEAKMLGEGIAMRIIG